METIIEAISNLAKDQGIANVISLALIWIIFNMQRGQKAETDQQNKLINQHGLTLEQLRRNTNELSETKIEVADLKTVMAEYIKAETANHEEEKANKQETQAAIQRGIETIGAHTNQIEVQTATIEKNTESVDTMNEQFKTLEQAIREVLDKVQGGMTLDEKTKNEIIAEVSKNISNTVHECMEKAIKATQETPKVEPEKPKSETVVAPIEPPQEKEKHEHEQSIGHSRRLDNTTGSDSDTGSSTGGDDSKTISA